MSENFLVSDSLKSSLSRETLYKKDYIDDCPVVLELRVNMGRIELDIMFSNINLKEHIQLNQFMVNEKKYIFSEAVEFYLSRIYRNKENLLLSTIFTTDKDFWRKLQ
jgi:hypothetical protein